MAGIAPTWYRLVMETIDSISAWLTPAIVIALFVWLRADIRSTREGLRADIRGTREELRADIRSVSEELRADIRGIDERLRAVEAGQAEIRGQLVILCDYILGRNLREAEEAPEAAPGD